jgi:DNA-binding FadR family transcriptional regulator
MDLVEARSHLEILSARLAAERRDEQDLVCLRELVEAMQRAEPDRDQLVRLDVAFHLGLARASKSETLSSLINSVAALLEVWISRVMSQIPTQNLHGRVYLEHAAVLDAVAQSDADMAELLAAEDMARAERSLQEALQASQKHMARIDTSQLLVTTAGLRRSPVDEAMSREPALRGTSARPSS